jgi:hypothetical protein
VRVDDCEMRFQELDMRVEDCAEKSYDRVVAGEDPSLEF